MARPKKRRGYSSIEVEGRKLAWRVSVDSYLHIQSDKNGRCLLHVDYGGHDPWLYPEKRLDFIAVKPGFVARAASYALKKGWQPESKLMQFNLRYVRDADSFIVERNPMFEVRTTNAEDLKGILALLRETFPDSPEAALVEALDGENLEPSVSMVATQDDLVVGQILFTPVDVVGIANWQAVALGPMAVATAQQRHGVGSQLVLRGLDACKSAEQDVVFVLGHPDYYPRFGFRPMADFGITCEFEAPREVLMVKELTSGVIAGRTGEVRYHPLFKSVTLADRNF